MEALDVLRAQMAAGLMEVRPDGTIWKLANRNNQQRVIPITPKRAERRSKNGYLMVKMEWMGQTYLLAAHVAVYELLKGPMAPGFEVNHEDGVKSNNRPDNLQPVTRGKNHEHAHRTGLRDASAAISKGWITRRKSEPS